MLQKLILDSGTLCCWKGLHMIYIHDWITHKYMIYLYTYMNYTHLYKLYTYTHAYAWIIYPWIIHTYVTYELYTFELYAYWIDTNYIYELYIYVYLYDSVPFGSILVGWAILDTRSRSERAPEHFSCSHLGCRFHCVFMCVLMCVCKVLYICQHQSVGQTLKRSHKYLVSPSSLPTDPCFLTWVLSLLIFLRGGLGNLLTIEFLLSQMFTFL